MTGLWLTHAVAPKWQNRGLGEALALRALLMMKNSGVTSVIGHVVEPEYAAFFTKIGGVFRDPIEGIGHLDFPISSQLTSANVPNGITEIVDQVKGDLMYIFPEDTNDVLATHIRWYDTRTGEAVAKTKFKIIN